MKRKVIMVILILAFCGLSDSIYIAQRESINAPLLCDANNLSGCNIVAASQYSHLFGISFAEYGIAFYVFIFVMAALGLVAYHRLMPRLLQLVSAIGVAASIYLTYIELFVIHAICIYCFASALMVLGIFIFASFLAPTKKIAPFS